MKLDRQRKIIELIYEYDIKTQEELAYYLHKYGFKVTQATLSRDIKQLSLTKVTTPKNEKKYALLPEKHIRPKEQTQEYNLYLNILRNGYISMELVDNIILVKTQSGLARAVAAALDILKMEGMIGTVSGNDMILCIIKEKEQAPYVMEQIKRIMEEEEKDENVWI